MRRYYDRQGRPCSEDEWDRLYDDRRVALTEVGEYRVSTVYLGRPVNVIGDVPLIFETSFSLGMDDDTVHTATEAEALAAHERLVNRLRAEGATES
jgi:hypothetical protein